MMSIKYCRGCEALVPGTNYCPQCGWALTDSTILCQHCQGTIPLGSEYCHYCGGYVKIQTEANNNAVERKENNDGTTNV